MADSLIRQGIFYRPAAAGPDVVEFSSRHSFIRTINKLFPEVSNSERRLSDSSVEAVDTPGPDG